jgi:tRNA modification GTPase
VLSPEGRGAVAVVRVWGPRALEVADAAFRPARDARLAESPAGRLRLGRMGAGLGDEVVAVIVAVDPRAVEIEAKVEAEVEVEIHCHGGPAPVALVVEALVGLGAERRQPAAWVRHASRAAIEAEALVDLTRAPTLRTAEVLLEQAQGALAGEVRRLIAEIADDPDAALRGLETLRRRASVGLRLVSGWRVVLAGRPNVGKSRLLNALAGYGRAIVDATPGTTRDVVTVRTALDGWPVELADTAGLRDPADAIEADGIALARARQGEADLVVVVLDRSEPFTEVDQVLTEAASGGRASASTLTVANKSDLAAAWEPHDPGIITISAERGDGIEALTHALAHRLVPTPPPAGAGVPFRPAHVRRLERAATALQAGDPQSAVRQLMALLTERTRRRDPSDAERVDSHSWRRRRGFNTI